MFHLYYQSFSLTLCHLPPIFFIFHLFIISPLQSSTFLSPILSYPIFSYLLQSSSEFHLTIINSSFSSSIIYLLSYNSSTPISLSLASLLNLVSSSFRLLINLFFCPLSILFGLPGNILQQHFLSLSLSFANLLSHLTAPSLVASLYYRSPASTYPIPLTDTNRNFHRLHTFTPSSSICNSCIRSAFMGIRLTPYFPLRSLSSLPILPQLYSVLFRWRFGFSSVVLCLHLLPSRVIVFLSYSFCTSWSQSSVNSSLSSTCISYFSG